MKIDTKKLALTAVFAVIALIIFVIEAQIPLTFAAPGLKLGLANIVILFVLFLGDNWKSRDVFMIFIVRVLLAALITGQLMSLIFSFTGGLFALIIMLVMKKVIKEPPIPVVSVGGAVCHNLGQITTAAVMMRSASVLAYLPALIAGGIISGLLTGIAVFILYETRPRFIGFLRR